MAARPLETTAEQHLVTPSHFANPDQFCHAFFNRLAARARPRAFTLCRDTRGPTCLHRTDAFFTQFPVLPFEFETIKFYAPLRAKIWHICGKPKPDGRGHIETLPEELCDDRNSGKQLGIDERDLQIVSIALQYNLSLATFDRNPGMKMIERAAGELKAAGEPIDLKIDDWNLPV